MTVLVRDRVVERFAMAVALGCENPYGQTKRTKRTRRKIKRLKTYLGRVFRGVRRKLEGRPEAAAHLAEPLTRVERLLAQQRTDKNKLYALHAPEAACIAKGKAHKRYEFGAKVSVAVTNCEGLAVGVQNHPGNPPDGQTLAPALAQFERLTGVAPERCYVDCAFAAMVNATLGSSSPTVDAASPPQ